MKQLARQIYQKIPFKQPFFELIKKIVRPGENIYKHLHFRGDFEVRIDAAHSFQMRHYGFELENELFWAGISGGWEKTSLGIWVKLVQTADVIFDIGANTGLHSLVAKALNPRAQVLAFEPVRRVFEKLEENNRLNGFDIACYELAASDMNGTATIYDTPAEIVYSVTVNKNLYPEAAEIIPTEIEITRLDSFIEQMGIGSIDLMKIDVETHEPEVLAGFGKYLEIFRPTMLIEILDDEVGARVEALVKEKNYLYFSLDEDSGSIEKVEKLVRQSTYNYLICNEKKAVQIGLL